MFKFLKKIASLENSLKNITDYVSNLALAANKDKEIIDLNFEGLKRETEMLHNKIETLVIIINSIVEANKEEVSGTTNP